MDRLFAPWRSSYINKEKQTEECPFCAAATNTEPTREHVLFADAHHVVLLNRYPYNSGHLLIVPREHAADLEQLSPVVRSALIEAASYWGTVLKKVFSCQGLNMGFNFGKVSGGSVPGHLHMHLVPRWTGDTNFLATVAETKLISMGLDEVYARLAPHATK